MCNKDISKDFLEILQKYDEKKLICMDVNLGVISKFQYSDNLKYDDLPEKIKDLYDEELDCNNNICLDLLGVYIAPTNHDQANILLSKEKIQHVADGYKIDYDCMYMFVKIHEYAHAEMCPILESKQKREIKRDAAYIIIEESLATAIALKRMKDTSQYNKLESFVKNQPLQYRYGLTLLSKFGNDIENLMKMWKLSKYAPDGTYLAVQYSENYNKCLAEELFEITKNDFFVPDTVTDIFAF